MLYVDYCSEEDQVLELARYLGKLREKTAAGPGQLIQQCEALVKANKYLEVLTKLLEESKELFVSGAEKDVESFLCLFASLVVKLGKDKLLHIKDQLFSAITGGQEKPIVRLSILNNLYNANDSTEWRVLVLTQILKFAAETKQFDVVSQLLDGLEERFKELNATVAQKREVLQAALTVARETNHDQSHALHTKFYQTFDGAADAETQPHIELAKKFFVDAISNPKIFQYDEIASTTILQHIGKSDAKLVELVNIFATGEYAEFQQFQGTNASVFESNGINVELASNKIRVLTVLSVISKAGGANGNVTSIPFSTFAAALKVADDEVENWIISAITEELLDARVDELSSSVHVTYALQRSFGKEQWKQLSEKLTIWKDNLRGMLKVIENSREQAYVELAQLQQQ